MGQETRKRPTRRGKGRKKQEGSSTQNPLFETVPSMPLSQTCGKLGHMLVGARVGSWRGIAYLEIENTQVD